jgi:hypothetical protein
MLFPTKTELLAYGTNFRPARNSIPFDDDTSRGKSRKRPLYEGFIPNRVAVLLAEHASKNRMRALPHIYRPRSYCHIKPIKLLAR